MITRRKPLLVQNINQDFRFGHEPKVEENPKTSYQTESCLLFPLGTDGRITGFMTFADKKNGAEFLPADLSLGLKLSVILSLYLEALPHEERKSAA